MNPRTACLALLALLGAACGVRTKAVQLKDLKSAQLSVHVDASTLPDGSLRGSVTAGLSSSDVVDGCPVLGSGVGATLNGAPMTALSLGGTSQALGIPGCAVPAFEIKDVSLPASAGVTSTVTLTDPTATFEVRIQGLGVARQVALVEPADGGLVVGQRATLAWSEPSDPLQASSTTVKLGSLADPSVIKSVTGADLSIANGRLSFTVPALPAGKLDVEVDASPSLVVGCTGGPRCSTNSPMVRAIETTVAGP